MGLERFQTEHQAAWDELEQLVRAAGSRPGALAGDALRRLGTLYRATAADLAQVRQRYPNDPLVPRLEDLVTRARALVYARDAGHDRQSPWHFFSTDYWRTLMARPGPLGLAALLLVGPALTGAYLATTDPVSVTGIVPANFLWVTEAQQATTDIGADAAGLTAFSTAVLVNNIQVTVLAFALGITFGLGTGLVTAYNGFILGAVAGLGVKAGNTALLVEAVAAHGILELSCIVVAAAAGLRVGSGLIMPGARTRRAALRRSSVEAVKLVIGTAPWLVLAGFVEGFVSRTGTPAGPAVALGLVLGGGFWWLAVVRGLRQDDRAADQNLASALARK